MIHVDPNSKAAKIIMALGLPLFAAGLALQLVYFCRSARSYGWPSVDGIVIESSVHDVHTEYGHSSEAKIEYAYTVGGTPYRNETVAFGLFRDKLSWGDAARKTAEFPRGRAVKVFYDPRRPRIACLRRGGVGWEDLFMLAVIVSGIVFGLRQVRRFFRWIGPGGAGPARVQRLAGTGQPHA